MTIAIIIIIPALAAVSPDRRGGGTVTATVLLFPDPRLPETVRGMIDDGIRIVLIQWRINRLAELLLSRAAA